MKKLNLERKENNMKGITLVALVISIIILLVLAGITVATLTGDNGLIKNTGSAKNQAEISEEKEQISIAIVNATKKNKWGDIEEVNLKKELENTKVKVTTSGNKFKVEYENGRKYLIDKNGNIRLKGDNELEINEIQDNASTYFGYDVINYKTASDDLDYIEWQLYYAGKIDEQDENEEEHIYLIAKDYVKNADLPTVIKNGQKVTKQVTVDGETVTQEVKPNCIGDYKANFDDVLNQYQGSKSITDPKIQKLNSKYFKYLLDNNITSVGSDNMKAVAYMLDTITWAQYTGKNAEYSIGGSTIELFFKAYNLYKKQGDLYQTKVERTNGYKISKDSGENWDYRYSSMIEGDKKENNKIVLDSPYIVSNYDSRNINLCWLASPQDSQYSSVYNLLTSIGFNGDFGSCSCKNELVAFRPLVCLNSDVSLEKVKDANEKDVFKIIE